MKKETFLTIGLIIISLVLVSFSGCEKKPEIEIIIKAPTVELVSVSDISETGATIFGRISNTGGSKITERGVYLNEEKSIVAYPLNSDATFSVKVLNLEVGTTYSVKTYAKNSQKTGYSSSIEFKTLKPDEPEPDPDPILVIKEVTEIGHHGAILHASASEIKDSQNYSISFEYGIDNNFDKSVIAEQVSSGQNNLSLSAKVESLKSVTAYNYRLKAENESGEVFLSDTATFTTSGDNFTIAGARFQNVATDSEGNVYANAQFIEAGRFDVLIAKFSSEGNLIWRTDVKGSHSEYTSGIIVHRDVVYVQVSRGDDPMNFKYGVLSVDAYNASDGKLLWSTVVNNETIIGGGLVVSEDRFIYSATSLIISKLDLAGNVVAEHVRAGNHSFNSIFVSSDKVFVSGSAIFKDRAQPIFFHMDKNLNLIWSQVGTEQNFESYNTGIVYFPEKNLIFVSETNGNSIQGVPLKSSILCYEFKDSGPTLKWKKFHDYGRILQLKKEGNNFYVYSTDFNFASEGFTGPTLLDTSAEVVWSLDVPQKGTLAVFENLLYMAQGKESLRVIVK